MDNSQLFPDASTRTSVLCHDVDVHGVNPVKQTKVNPEKTKAFQQ